MTGAFEPADGVSAIDRAFRSVHAGGLRAALITWMGIMPFVFVATGIYYAEFVEGLRLPRAGYAVLIAGAWVWRGLRQTEATRIYLQTLWPTARLSSEWERAGLTFAVFSGWSALVFGAFVAATSMDSPVLVIAIWPLAALRALGIPGLWGFAALADRSNTHSYAWAWRTASWIRAGAFGAALLFELAIVITCINLTAFAYLVSALARSMLAIDTATVSEFLNPSNGLSAGLLLGATLALAEPVRAALSAVHAVDALSRRDALDLRERIATAVKPRETGTTRTNQSASIAHVLLVLAAFTTGSLGNLICANDATAQPKQPPEFEHPVQAPRRAASRERVASEVRTILKKDAYQDFVDHRKGSASSVEWLFDRLGELLKKLFEGERTQGPSTGLVFPGLALPSGTVFLALAAAALIAVASWRIWTWKRSPGRPIDGETHADSQSPLELIALADERAGAGDLRDALRALYVATLVALDRDGAIQFEPHLTNGHYVRGMQLRARDASSRENEAAVAFREFTRIFDRVWYGKSPPERAEFDACRVLAVRVCGEKASPSAGGVGGNLANA